MDELSSLLNAKRNEIAGRNIRIAVEGCCHGELDLIYSTISGANVDLLLICGDFQCVRAKNDLNSMAVPQKYRTMNTFHKYFSGEKLAPVLTIIIGGNHEASNVLQSLYYGGYIAPNIYFLGFGGVVWYGGLRIAGISGIYNPRHYHTGHYEYPPYSDDTIRSVYHVREIEIYRMMHLREELNHTNTKTEEIKVQVNKPKVDIFLSHDWPASIWEYGNKAQLLKKKPYFRDDMQSGKLGNPPLMSLLEALQPSFWFAAHLHVKFEAFVPHQREFCYDVNNLKNIQSGTHFLALDKAIRGRNFIEIIDIPIKETESNKLHMALQLTFDPKWLTVLAKSHPLLTTTRNKTHMPSSLLSITNEDIQYIQSLITQEYGQELIIPEPSLEQFHSTLDTLGNIQTDRLLNALQLHHIWTRPVPVPIPAPQSCAVVYKDINEINLDDDGVEGGEESDANYKEEKLSIITKRKIEEIEVCSVMDLEASYRTSSGIDNNCTSSIDTVAVGDVNEIDLDTL